MKQINEAKRSSTKQIFPKRGKSRKLLLVVSALFAGLQLGACDLFTRTVIDATPGEVTTLHLVRGLQTIRRFDCAGKLYSEKEEEVIKANALVEIRPKFSTNQIYSSSFYNRSTHASSGAVRGYIGVYVDISPNSALGMHVREGLNEITYKYYECVAYEANANPDYPPLCIQQRILEEGMVTLDVSYQLKRFEAVEEIHDSCPTPPSP